MSIAESPKAPNDLPGGPAIERTIQECLERQEIIAALYIDLINFEPYCLKYGWLKGTQLVTMLSHTIQNALASVRQSGDIVGHICGDDFIVVTVPERAEWLAQEIIRRFDESIKEFYNEEDRLREYFDTVDRRGNPYRAYIAGVAIAIVSNAYRDIDHALQFEGIAAEVKKYIKMLPSSRYAFDRRHK